MKPVARGLWSRETLSVIAVLMLSVCVIYSPVLEVDFLFRDDYIFFTRPKGWTLTKIELPHARPLLGVIVDLLNTSVVTGAGIKRLVSVLGLGSLACLVCAWLRKYGLHVLTAALLSLSVCALSSFQSTASYLTVTGSIYAAVFSCLAVHVYFRDGSPQPRRTRLYRIVLTSLLLFTALSCYQPGAMFCWAVLVVPVYLVSRDDWPQFRLALLRFGLIFAVTLVPYLLFYKAAVLLAGIPLSPRSEWANPGQIVAKLIWFSTWSLLYVGGEMLRPLYSGGGAKAIKFVCLAVALGGLMYSLGRQERRFPAASSAERIGLLAVLVILGYLPFLVTREYGMESIYTTAIQSSLLLAVFLGLRGLLEMVRHPVGKQRLEVALGAAVCGLLAISCNANLLREFVLPNRNEYSYVKSAIAKADMTKVTRIHTVGTLHFSEVLSYPEALVRGVLNELWPGRAQPEITSSSKTAPSAIHVDILAHNAAVAEFYELHPTQGYYVIKPDLTAEQRAALDGYFAKLGESLSEQPNVLVIDLSRATIAY